MKKLKLSTVFTIVGLVSFLLALWFMYKETSNYYETTFDLDKEPETEEEEETEKPVKDETDKPGSESQN
jgi:hypothetical protein